MTERVLPYDRNIVPQETGYWCGPASTQVVLNSLGINIPESQLAREIGTHTGGTDHIGLIERVLDQRAPHHRYTSVQMPNDPPTQSQKARLWDDLTRSINAGCGVVMNWVAPPNNYPRGVKGSVSPAYSGGTVYHYVAAMGYDDTPGFRAVWIADSGFRPFGYWVDFEQCARLIPPKGYCYAAATTPAPAPAPPKAPALTKADGYALAIIAEGRRRGITERGIVIALSTALVESGLKMYANAKVPDSLQLPHDAVGSDAYSVGLFQQQVVRGANGWWWGDAATCMDPAKSAGLFYDRLAKFTYNDPARTPGWFAAEIQRPAAQYRDRYDQRMPEAQAIYNRLAKQTDPLEELMQMRVPSLSIYADPDEPDVAVVDMIRALDAHGPHEAHVESRARLGDPDAIRRLARTAAGRGRVTDPTTIAHAKAKLAEVPEQFLTSYLGAQR